MRSKLVKAQLHRSGDRSCSKHRPVAFLEAACPAVRVSWRQEGGWEAWWDPTPRMQVSTKEKSSARYPPCVAFTSPPQGIPLSDNAHFIYWALQGCLKKFSQLPGIVWYLFILSCPASKTTTVKSRRQLGAACAYSRRGGWSSELLARPRVPAARTRLWSPLLRGMVSHGSTWRNFKTFSVPLQDNVLSSCPYTSFGFQRLLKRWELEVTEDWEGLCSTGGSVLHRSSSLKVRNHLERWDQNLRPVPVAEQWSPCPCLGWGRSWRKQSCCSLRLLMPPG